MSERRATRQQRARREQTPGERFRLEAEDPTHVSEREDSVVMPSADPAFRLARPRAVAMAELTDRVEQHREPQALRGAIRNPKRVAGEKLLREDDIGNGHVKRPFASSAALHHGEATMQKRCQPLANACDAIVSRVPRAEPLLAIGGP